MKYGERTMAGNALRSAAERVSLLIRPTALAAVLALLAAGGAALAQSLYKYRGDDGEWIFTDRPPDDDSLVEVRELKKSTERGHVDVAYSLVDGRIRLVASNNFYIPIELKLAIESMGGLQYPDSEEDLHWVIPARRDVILLDLGLLDNGVAPFLEYSIKFHPGDPEALHQPDGAYRVPYAVASNYPVTQAYPVVATHTSLDSYYAIDIAMPIGTDIFAARDGIVFDVASGNFSVGLDRQEYGPKANVVQVLHDDGTYAIYAHLNTNTVRVRPGDRVARGEYIADSGNTGFSSGPHLHFAIIRNAGMRSESIPFAFEGANDEFVTPSTGMLLTAY